MIVGRALFFTVLLFLVIAVAVQGCAPGTIEWPVSFPKELSKP